MPSSTSSSDARDATRAIAVLLIGLALYGLALEMVTRVGFSRISRIRRRVEQDLQAARTLRPRAPDGAPTMLVVGNSLLLEGVEREPFVSSLAPKYRVALFPIENTAYEDWYFGLRRLFAGGARPAIVAVSLTTRQMMSPSTNGEHFAHYLMMVGDLPDVKRESGLDNTTTSAYFFANQSEWLGSRNQIRKWLLLQLVPSVDRVTAFFPTKAGPMLPTPKVVAAVMPRLEALARLCRENGARLVVIVPPMLAGEAVGAAEVQAAAAKIGLPVVVPLGPGEVTAEDFSDGFHLNPRGAARFTPLLSRTLVATLTGDGRTPANAPVLSGK
jgi:hypothetical protein